MLKRFFLARNTVLTLILSALLSVTVGGFVPQTFITNPAELNTWRLLNPFWARTADILGLHHIYTTPVFAAILSGVLLSLFFSCVEQFGSAQKMMTAYRRHPTDEETLHSPQPIEDAYKRLRADGFIMVGRHREEMLKVVRHPWGYWGKFLFHFGMLVTMMASLFIALTQERAVLKLTVGESFHPGQKWQLSEHGLMAHDLRLADKVRLDRVDYAFWPSFGLRDLASSIVFTTPAGEQSVQTARVNTILAHEGLRIYQDTEFGHSFYLEVTGPDSRTENVLLEIPWPTKPDQPSYQDYPDVLGPGRKLLVKYSVNDSMKSFEPIDPTLTLRIDRQGQEIGRVSLKKGQDGTIGPYRFTLLDYTNWSQLIFVKLRGIEAVFFGFLVICLGGILHYFTPPREAMLRAAPGGGTLVAWRAVRFAEFYRGEYEQLKEKLCGRVGDG